MPEASPYIILPITATVSSTSGTPTKAELRIPAPSPPQPTKSTKPAQSVDGSPEIELPECALNLCMVLTAPE